MNRIPLSNQKEKLVREDIEKYLLGQMKLKDIAVKRNLSMYVVGRIGRKVVYEKMNNKMPTLLQCQYTNEYQLYK